MKQQFKRSAQAGFTLIELIVVIVILGILAATALPKFMDMGGDARVASLNGALGALKTASSMVHGKALITPAADNKYTIEGAVVTADALSAYPVGTKPGAGDNGGFVAAAGLSANDYLILYQGEGDANFAPTVGANEIVIIPKSVSENAKGKKCYIKYTAATVANTAPTFSNVPVASDC